MVYKVLVDLDSFDLNRLAQEADKRGISFCVADDSLFFHIIDDTSTQISNIMKKMRTSGFIVKEVKEKPSNPDKLFSDLWCFEKMTEDEEREFNNQHQAELHQMMDNIERVRQEWIQQKIKKEESSTDGTERREDGGASEKENAG